MTHALRSLRSTPVAAVFAAGLMAAAVGSATSLYSVADALVFRALPVPHARELAVVGENGEEQSYFTYRVWREIAGTEIFADGFAWEIAPADISKTGIVQNIPAIWTTGGLFSTLGIAPAAGRFFSDNETSTVPVVVISYDYWQRRFSGDSAVVGRTIDLERTPCTIIGVTPQGFFGPEVGARFDVAIPLSAEPVLRGERSHARSPFGSWFEIMVRLRPGQSASAASAALRAVQPAIRDAAMPPYAQVEARRRFLRAPLEARAARLISLSS